MNTGIVKGTLLAIYVGGTKIAVLTANSLSRSRPTRETANKDSGDWVTRLPNRNTWTISGSAYFAFDAAYGYDDLFDVMDAGTAVTIMRSTEESGDSYYSGDAYLTQLDADDPDDDNSSYSFTFEGSGQLSKAAVT